MYLLIEFACQSVECNLSPLILFSTLNNISISVERYNFTLVFFKAAYHANPGAERNFAESFSYILRYIFRKFSYT